MEGNNDVGDSVRSGGKIVMGLQMGGNWNMSRSVNSWGLFNINQVEMKQCCREVVSANSLGNDGSLQLGLALVLHDFLLVPVLMYRNDILVWRGNERSRMRTVQRAKT